MPPKRLVSAAAIAGTVAAVQLLGPAPAASARTPIDVGPVLSPATALCNGSRQFLGSAWVTLYGDWVTVIDRCDDGRRVEGRVGMVVNGQTKTYRCINSMGPGWTKECNFDWTEANVGMKSLLFYYETAPGSNKWTLGTVEHWREG